MNSRRFLQSIRESRRRRNALVAVPFVLIAVVTAVDVSVPPDVHLGPFLVAAPAVAASFTGPRMTAFVGAVAVLAQALVAVTRTSLNDLNHTYQIIALVLISVFVTFFAHLRVRNEQAVAQLRSVAEAAQHVVLRPLPARSGPLRIASVYLAAEAEAQIGGDLYAAARTMGGTRLIIGDVRGKGLAAIGEAASVLGAFHALSRQRWQLPELVAHLETSIAPDPDDRAPEGGDEPGEHDPDLAESFVTAAVLDIPDDDAEVRLVSCGHPPPLLLRAGEVIPLGVRVPAPPLGLTHLVITEHTAETFGFEAGDTLLLYTDGVIESRDRSGNFYPLRERAASRGGAGPDALLESLCTDLLRHAGGRLGDDAALVAIERLPAPGDAAPAPRSGLPGAQSA
ncbi:MULTISPECIES: PP2C family protein-serine/threonine phosphatase [unclassified Streptomyces]|uniref:PP2C family protein-serine/threonine phosphatase n=1 Tax=unclassified Streptomyces TaxID=2593676 RepID=UPI002E76CFCE|nr:PP2C family protein-serine/threonine phosphatase [Streptomyces sp. JV190]MEE1841170.1 PP2C family protein-serine/threonine phosphatase [Streptomyces sp. JV190]